MTIFEVEEISCENPLIRSYKVNINGSKIITPTKTVSVTKNDDSELKIASHFIGKNYHPLGEVYTSLSIDELNLLKNKDEIGMEFNNKISNRLSALKNEGIVPYLVISINDNNKNPYNQMLPDDLLEFVFDILWGASANGNSIIVPPLMGLLPDKKDYIKLINALNARVKMNIDRKILPVMATIPSSYNLIDPKLLEEYWNIGCRMFAFNCENKKYGGYGYMIEKLHKELTVLSKKNDEKYILNALNSKFKVGKQESSRINNLLGAGFGFDIYSKNHIAPKFMSNNESNHFLFNSNDYGFETLSNVCTGNEKYENILNSITFKNMNLEKIDNSLSVYQKRNITSKYNTEQSIKEVSLYSQYINENELYNYFSNKTKIRNELVSMEKISGEVSSPSTRSLDEWF